MRQQRNLFQTKEQDKNHEEQLSEMQIGNLPGKEFSDDSKDDPRSQKQNGGTD